MDLLVVNLSGYNWQNTAKLLDRPLFLSREKNLYYEFNLPLDTGLRETQVHIQAVDHKSTGRANHSERMQTLDLVNSRTTPKNLKFILAFICRLLK